MSTAEGGLNVLLTQTRIEPLLVQGKQVGIGKPVSQAFSSSAWQIAEPMARRRFCGRTTGEHEVPPPQWLFQRVVSLEIVNNGYTNVEPLCTATERFFHCSANHNRHV